MGYRALDYIYILLTIVFTVYGQIILKWRISYYGAFPELAWDRVIFFTRLLMDPYIFSSLLSAFFAALAWMAAMTKFELSHAYPFMSLSFVLVLIMSGLLLAEDITIAKTAGVALIVAGTIIASR